MDLLSFAAETGSIEEWIDLDPHPRASLARQAEALGAADADRGVKVRSQQGATLLGALADMFRETATPLANPVLESHRKHAYDRRCALIAAGRR